MENGFLKWKDPKLEKKKRTGNGKKRNNNLNFKETNHLRPQYCLILKLQLERSLTSLRSETFTTRTLREIKDAKFLHFVNINFCK